MHAAAKKLTLVLAVIALLVSVLAVTVNATEGDILSPDGDPLTYTVLSEEAKTVSVSACADGQENITIPASVNGYTVTLIKGGLLEGNTSLQTIKFDNGCQIEKIENAFNDCVNLKSIDWGTSGSLIEITRSFQGCSALTALTIPPSVETLGEDAFADCINLKSLSFAQGSNLKVIGKEAFAYTGKDDDTVPATISSLTLPASLETLGKGAFHCVPVQSFALEDHSKLTMIPNGFLAADGKDGQPGVDTECTSLLDYVEGVFKYIGFSEPYPFTPAKAAQACDCLESIDFGNYNALTMIGPGAFKNQTHLTAIDFGQNAAAETLTIKNGAFIAAGNNAATDETLGSGINTLTLPANLSVLDTGCFKYARITNLVFSNGSKLKDIPYGFMTIEGADAAPMADRDYQMDSYLSKNDKAIIIAANCLKTIDFGSSNSLADIQSGAFKNQSHLTAIDFGSTSNALTIESGAFAGAGNNAYLVEQNIDKTLNAGITRIVLPAKLSNLNGGAFNLARIKNIELTDGCRLNDIPYSFMAVQGVDGQPGASDTYNTVVIPLSVSYAADCLETIDFGKNNNLANIYGAAFKNQSRLTSIDFGTSEVNLTIGWGAFAGAGNNAYLVENGTDSSLNAGIENLVFPANLSSIWTGAFNYARINNVKFSDSCRLEEIPYGFMSVEGDDGALGVYDIAGSYSDKVSKSVLIGADSLKTIKFGKNNNIASIQTGAFKNQSHMTGIDFGTSTANLNINSGAFAGVGNNGYLVENGTDSSLNAGIETLVFPANLSSLDTGSFNCARVKNVKFSDGCQLSTIPYGFMSIEGDDAMPGAYVITSEDNDKTKQSVLEAANALKTIDFGKNNNLATIQTGAFKNQSHMTGIDFGTSAVNLTIYSGAFVGAGNNGYLVYNSKDTALNDGIDTLTMPANLTTLESGSFKNARIKNIKFTEGCNLTQIIYGFMAVEGEDGKPGIDPSTHSPYKNIPSSVFTAANSLESIDFGDNNSLTNIQYGAIKNQTHLTSIDFGTHKSNANLALQSGAFVGTAPETLVIPARTNYLGSGVFKKASVIHLLFEDSCRITRLDNGFMSRDYNDDNFIPVLQSVDFGNNPGLSYIGDGAFAGNCDLKTLNLSNTGVQTICGGAFNDCGLTQIIFSPALNTLNYGAFQGLDDLETLTIGSDCPLTSLTDGVFSDCRKLKTVDLENSNITSIDDVLKNDPALEKVILPKKLESIYWNGYYEDKCMFYGSGNVTKLYFTGTDASQCSFSNDVFQFLNGSVSVYFPAGTTDENISAYKTKLAGSGVSFEEGNWKVKNSLFTVSFDSMGHGSAPDALTNLSGGSKVTKPADPVEESEPGYSFAGWYKEESFINIWDFDNDTISDDTTLYAKWSYKETITPSVGESGAGTPVAVTVTDDSATVSTINPTDIAEVTSGENVTIDLSSAKNDISNVSLTKSTLENIAGSNADGVEIKLSNDISVSFDKTALNAIASQAGIAANVTLELNTGEKAETSMNKRQQKALESMDKPLVVDIHFNAGDTRISDLNGGSAEVTVPYVSNKSVRAWYINDLAEKTAVLCEKIGNSVTLLLGHNSYYVIEETTDSNSGSGNNNGHSGGSGGGGSSYNKPDTTNENISTPAFRFDDVADDAYYKDSVDWAVANNITSGTDSTHFSPDNMTTRAQMVTFLWRAAGSPEPTLRNLPFSDVTEDSYFYKAVLWAAEKEITSGISEDKFAPDEPVTRAQSVVYLYRYVGIDTLDIKINPFSDIKDGMYYTDAVLWANAKQITNGTSASEFSPDMDCTRAQIVTFLYRCLGQN